MRRVLLALSVFALAALVVPVGTQADDPQDPRTLELKIYPVGSLTLGRWFYVREREPLVSAWNVGDEEHPLFGATAHEPRLPVGSIDELIELLKMGVAPAFWENQEGADVRTVSHDRLLVRATPEVHAQVQAFLDEVQAVAGRTVTVELQWVRVGADVATGMLPQGGDPMVLGADQAQSLFSGKTGASTLQGPGVSVCCFSGQRAAVTGGRQVAWLQDADVEVAQEAQTTDPIVGVSNLGMMAQVLPLLTDEGAFVGIDCALANWGETHPAPTERNGLFQVPTHRIISVRPVLRLPAGKWAVAEGRRIEDGARWWLLLVRVTPHAYESTPGRGAVADLGRPIGYHGEDRPNDGDARGAMAFQGIDIDDLAVFVENRAGEGVNLWPSNFAPSEPPELSEPQPTFSAESLVDLARIMAVGDVWEDPAMIDARGGVICVRNTPSVLQALRLCFQEVRRSFTWSLVTTAEVVEVSDAIGLDLAAGGVLDERLQRVLDEARGSGQARTVDGLRLTSYRSARNVVRAGDEVTYLQDYEVEIAQAAEIGNPVFQTVLSGAQLDIQAARSPDGGSVQLNVEFVRTDVERPIRKESTTQGDIEVPSMEVFRIRTGLQVPLGRTALAGSWTKDGRRRLLLLTPRLR